MTKEDDPIWLPSVESFTVTRPIVPEIHVGSKVKLSDSSCVFIVTGIKPFGDGATYEIRRAAA